MYLYIHVYHRSFLSVHPLLARCNSSSKLSCQTYFTIWPRPGNALVYIVVRFRADRSIACIVKRGALDNVVRVSNEVTPREQLWIIDLVDHYLPFWRLSTIATIVALQINATKNNWCIPSTIFSALLKSFSSKENKKTEMICFPHGMVVVNPLHIPGIDHLLNLTLNICRQI